MALADNVQNALDRAMQPRHKEPLFSPEALEALKLAEQFCDIEPEPYVLPLDAMAGFPALTKTNRTSDL